MENFENYVFKAEINWSMLTEGITLPIKNQVIFKRNMGEFLQKGETKSINIYFNGGSYSAQIRNVNFDQKFNRKNDILQIRYSRNGSLAKVLQTHFYKSYNFIANERELRQDGSRAIIKLPNNCKEYLAIYTTEYEDSYLFEAITADDLLIMKNVAKNQSERVLESNFDFYMEDKNSTIVEMERISKIRKLNRKIGDNLKLLYSYRCQICGKLIGEKYGTKVIESHHIDYYVNSLNNDASNQLIVCPNHHSIIHESDPVFEKKNLLYLYPNGVRESLQINLHL